MKSQLSHYDWLDKFFPKFCQELGINFQTRCAGIVSAHGDKCYGYQHAWTQAGIPFERGVAIFFLSYLKPWDQETRETAKGWVNVKDWVIQKYPEFKEIFDKIEGSEE